MKAEMLTICIVVSILGCVQGRLALGQEPRVDPLVVVIDSNKDGIIDVGELRGAPVSIRTLDLNNDGAVSRDEASGREKQNRGGGSRLGGYTVPPPANNVPDHLFNIIVGRLTASTATVRVLFHQSSTVLIQYGDRSGSLVRKTGSCSLEPGAPVDFVLEGLKGNTLIFIDLFTQSMPSNRKVKSTRFIRNGRKIRHLFSQFRQTRILMRIRVVKSICEHFITHALISRIFILAWAIHL